MANSAIPEWQKIQQKAFTNWFNSRLKGNLREAVSKVNDPAVDLRDGVLLNQLVQILLRGKRKMPRYIEEPRMKLQKLQNLGQVLRVLKEENVKLVNIGPEDLMGGNRKLWLGLIWTLIDKYQIKSGGKRVSTKQAMLAWINSIIPELHIKNFTTDWNNGIALCSLIDALRPGLCPNHASLNPKTGLANCELGMDLAEKHMNIPPLLDPIDLNNPIVDELSVMTYLSYFADESSNSLMQWIQEKIPEQNITNFSTDWNNGIALSALVDAIHPGLLPHYNKLQPTKALDNVKHAMKVACERLSVQETLSAAEITDPKVDEVALAAYLANFKNTQVRAAPGQCLADGSGLKSATVNQAVEFKLDASQAGSGKAHVNVCGPSTSPTAELSHIKGNVFMVTYTPAEVGVHTVEVTYDDEQVPNSPFTVPVVDPTACHITGHTFTEGCIVGKPLEFVVETQNAGPGLLTTALFGPTGSQPLTSTEHGSCVAFEAKPQVAGNYSLDIKWSGFGIPGSPFALHFSDPSKCQLLTSAKEGRLEKVGVPVEIGVDTRRAGPGTLTALAEGPSRTVHLQAEESNDFIHTIIFVPGEAGSNSIKILWDSKEIPGSPFTVDVVDTSLCFFEQVPSYGQVGKPVQLQLITQQSVVAPLQVRAQNEVGGLLPCSVKSVGQPSDGIFNISFSPSQVGTLEIDATWAGEQVPQCPFDVKVCDAARCSAYGPGLLHGGKLGEPFEFTVQAKDAGEGSLSVRPCGPKAVNSASVRDNGDGTYDVAFTPWEIGSHQIDVEWGGEPVPNSPYSIEVQGRVLLSQLAASGEGLKEAIALSPAEFHLAAGEPGLTDEGQLQVEVQAVQDEAAVDITDGGDGNYTITYVAPSSGQYMINVFYGGEHAPGSPFRAVVMEKPDPLKCIVSGAFLEHGAHPEAGDPLELTVATKDAGHGKLKVTASGPGGKAARVFMANDTEDEHSVRIDTGLAGPYIIDVFWSGERVTGSPFEVEVASRLKPQQMQVYGEGLKVAIVDTQALFTVNAVEAGLFDKGKLTVSVTSLEQSAAIAVKDNSNGLYDIMYTATHPGRYNIAVRYNGVHLSGSPFPVTVTSKPNAQKCHASGKSLEKGAQLRTGEAIEFAVETCEAGDGQLGVRAAGKHGETLRAFTSDEGGGRFWVRVDAAQTSGTYMLHCCWSGEHIPGSPFELNIDDNLTCSMIKASGKGLHEAFAMEQTTVTISAPQSGLFDKGHLRATVIGPDGHLSIATADRGNGQYSLTYMAPSVGEYLVSILLQDDDIPGSPFAVQVYMPPIAERCHAHGPCLQGDAVVGKAAEFEVNTSEGGHGKLTIQAHDPDGKVVRTFLSDGGEGCQTVRMDPATVGQYTVAVLWSTNHIPGSPFTVNVVESVDSNAVVATGAGLSRAFSMMPAAFTITAPEPGLYEKGDITIAIENAMQGKAAEIDVRDKGDGTYTVNYMAPSTGAFIASIKYRSQAIPASPFKITVFPRPRPENCHVSGSCLEPKALNITGKPLQFVVSSKNAGYGRLTVKVVDPDGSTGRAYVADEDKTRHVIRVETKAAGYYSINVKWATIPIPGSPFRIRVHPAPNARKVIAEGPGLMNGEAGQPTFFNIKTHGAGMGELRVRMHGVKGAFHIKVNRDDSDPRLLHAVYTPTKAGTYEISVLWSGEHIQDSPFRLTIGETERAVAPALAQAPRTRTIKRTIVPISPGQVYPSEQLLQGNLDQEEVDYDEPGNMLAARPFSGTYSGQHHAHIPVTANGLPPAVRPYMYIPQSHGPSSAYQMRSGPLRGPYTDDDIDLSASDVFAPEEVYQQHSKRHFTKSASTSNVQETSKGGLFNWQKKPKKTRKMSDPNPMSDIPHVNLSRKNSISAVPRGPGFVLSAGGKAKMTGELRPGRPYRLDYM